MTGVVVIVEPSSIVFAIYCLLSHSCNLCRSSTILLNGEIPFDNMVSIDNKLKLEAWLEYPLGHLKKTPSVAT